MTLSEILDGLGTRFIRVARQNKKPIDDEWTTAKAWHTWKDLEDWRRRGNNVGIRLGDGLVGIDGDTPQVAQSLESSLPETLVIQSGGGGRHYYYYLEEGNLDPDGNQDRDIPLDDDAEGSLIRGNGQLLSPGSIHPNGKKYIPVKVTEIPTISRRELFKALDPWLKTWKEKRAIRNAVRKERRTQTSGIADDLRLEQVLDPTGLKVRAGGQLQGPHPIHGSSTGQNLSVDLSDGVWHCFRHQSGGDAWLWLAVTESVLDCSDAGPGALDADRFKEVLRVARDRGLVAPASRVRVEDPEVKDAAIELLEDPAILHRIRETRGFIKGEHENKCYLVLAILAGESVEVQGLTAAGKNTLVDSILRLFPPDWSEKITGTTDKGVRYLGDQVRILYIAEREGISTGKESTSEYDIKLAISEGTIRIGYPVKDKETGVMRTEFIETQIDSILMTSSEVDLPEELENRLHVIHVDDTIKQNEAVRDYYLDQAQLLPSERANYESDLAVIQAALQIVDKEAPKDVLIDYAPLLKQDALLSPKETRVRRDVQKLIALIGASARLHYKQRTVIQDQGTPILQAQPEDFWMVWKIGKDSIQRSFAGMSEQLRNALEACKTVEARGKEQTIEQGEGMTKTDVYEGITSTLLAEEMGVATKTAYTYLKSLERKNRTLLMGKGKRGINLYSVRKSAESGISAGDISVDYSELGKKTGERLKRLGDMGVRFDTPLLKSRLIDPLRGEEVTGIDMGVSAEGVISPPQSEPKQDDLDGKDGESEISPTKRTDDADFKPRTRSELEVIVDNPFAFGAYLAELDAFLDESERDVQAFNDEIPLIPGKPARFGEPQWSEW